MAGDDDFEDGDEAPRGKNKGNQNNAPKSVLDQAMAAINKGAKEGVVNKLKAILARKQEHVRGAALADAEAKQLVEDYEAGLL